MICPPFAKFEMYIWQILATLRRSVVSILKVYRKRLVFRDRVEVGRVPAAVLAAVEL